LVTPVRGGEDDDVVVGASGDVVDPRAEVVVNLGGHVGIFVVRQPVEGTNENGVVLPIMPAKATRTSNAIIACKK
jgi:hypothetical protein